MRDTILLTGSTGVIGRALVPLLAERRDVEHVYALMRGGGEVANLEKVKAVPGDIAAGERLGLSDQQFEEISENVTVIIHAAADTRFSASLSQLQAANVDGTQNVLDFARRCRSLRGIVCLSTVHVAGQRTDAIEEDIVEHSAGFVNCYEQSKYESELVLREGMGDLPIFLQLVNLGFDVEQLNSLQSAINQPRHAVEKSKTQEVLVKKEEKRGSGNEKKPLL
jgi:thioester reductase-like protein